jgi:hypothetical protein
MIVYYLINFLLDSFAVPNLPLFVLFFNFSFLELNCFIFNLNSVFIDLLFVFIYQNYIYQKTVCNLSKKKIMSNFFLIVELAQT